MEAFKLFLIFIVIVIFTYVLLRLLDKRAKILSKNKIEGMAQSIVEGATTAASNEVTDLQTKAPTNSITNLIEERQNLALREYCVKSAYAAAFSGNYVSSDMILYNINNRVCRYLDIPIYWSKTDNVAYTAHINDPDGIDMASDNKVPIDTIFNKISSNAFSADCPANKDPLFIKLRIYPDAANKIYNRVASSIKNNFKTNRYVNDDSAANAKLINGDIPFSELMGKVIFFIDKNINANYADNNQDIANCMNGEIGGTTFAVNTYGEMINKTKTPPKITDNFKKTNISTMSGVVPDAAEIYPHPHIPDMVIDYGVQTTLYKFYKRDDELNLYEDLFNEYKSAFVPMAYAITYLKQKQQEITSKKITYGGF